MKKPKLRELLKNRGLYKATVFETKDTDKAYVEITPVKPKKKSKKGE